MAVTIKFAIAIILVVAALNMPAAECSIYTISDDRVRNMDITPVLGRGYSIMTNMYHSTCLMVDETTVPSYNYEYYFYDFTSSTTKSEDKMKAKSGSFSGMGINQARSESEKSSLKMNIKRRFIAATMRIERYYSSVREEVSPLSSDAKQLLSIDDYIGFFNACGPNYVRGIRRAQEVSAMFQFESVSLSLSREFSFYVRKQSDQTQIDGKSKFDQAQSSLQIGIEAWGIGLSQEGSETLVATTLTEYNKVMKFAFRTMTQIDDSYKIGMIYGIEVVPWVHNTAFQAAAKLGENVIIPMPKSLIARAVPIDRTTSPSWGIRTLFECTNSAYKMDKFGFCCEDEQLYDITNLVYRTIDDADGTIDVCRPMQILDKSLVKDNMSNNGEFVSRLGSAVRFKLNSLGTLEQCISKANSIPDEFIFNFVKKKDMVKYDDAREINITLAELKLGIDPQGDYGLLKHMGQELDEWVEMYYSPCLLALFGTNEGTTPDIDVQYFAAHPWHTHPECLHLTCLTNNFRWDRENGGCVPGLVNGRVTATNYGTGAASQEKCTKDVNRLDGTTEVCKYDQGLLNSFTTRTKNCWNDLQISNVFFFIENYCMPQVTEHKFEVTSEASTLQTKTALSNLYYTCKGVTPPPVSRRLSSETEDLSPTESSAPDDPFTRNLAERMRKIQNKKLDKERMKRERSIY